MSSRLSQEHLKNQEKFDFKIQESSFKNQDSRIIKIKIQDSRFKNQEKTQSRSNSQDFTREVFFQKIQI